MQFHYGARGELHQLGGLVKEVRAFDDCTVLAVFISLQRDFNVPLVAVKVHFRYLLELAGLE